MAMQPSTVMPQPISALNPYGASDAGSRKMPMPMVLPTTRAVQVQKPIFLLLVMRRP
jgi:hypothetical protein